MTPSTLAKKYNQIKRDIARFKTKREKQLEKYARQFLKAHCPTVEKKVYEVVRDKPKRRGYTRFVVYLNKVTIFDSIVTVNAWGWWLNSNNVPSRWDHLGVYGYGNCDKVILSKNQKAEKHPNAKHLTKKRSL